jgi:glycosyltransferase involved in cell wall biosynthesis
LGKVPHAETYNYLKAADVFILNSQYEGISHALLDAMSAGIPILAANVGGNPELVENGVNGFLFEYNNKKEILMDLEKILADADLRKKFTLSAQEKVKKFSWEGVVEKTEEVIKNIK